MNTGSNIGKVYLIGAGPGDAGLITLRGAELLARCDVVLYDGLSNTELLAHAASAEHISVGKHGQTRIWRQPEIIDEMLRHAQAGRVVARLKGGDPAVFARTAEEVDALKAAQIPFEIVPGITAALAAGSFAGIPVTHRGLASAVALVTGHEEPGKAQSALDWDALARFPGTLVVYMGVTTAEAWTTALIAAGKPADTPVALVRRCSLPDQQSIHCRLDEVADRLTPASKFRPPVIVIIGPVTELAESMDWVSHRPLFGKTVMVTRPAAQSAEMASQLRELGAEVLIQPAIEIAAPDDWSQVDDAIDRLQEFQTIIFCSHNAVRFFIDRMIHRGGDVRRFAGAQIAVTGSKTAQSLMDYHVRADTIPSDFRAESVVESLLHADNAAIAGQSVLIVRADRGRDVLMDQLTAAGADVAEIAAYQNRDVDQPIDGMADRIQHGDVDWITVTSSASASNLHRMFGESLHHSRIASLSPITSATIRAMGFSVHAEADPYTTESLIDAIVQATSSPDRAEA
ncbi:Uroporphyrinogen-III C-methyltransferase [Rubripirellula lacrimiformis]|uniref:uroporphyrinogen-III C-methyltransferase n=1 Tax=Rubripirellula lacrimiformis TaxID=1930273 RepID=A0A517N570_9BACT|nr:uroporphyrinogen-III C-methyltransferase [Rubripirellula lacrimiformis]QDT02280.1 Uroporphyrinogen-III C-methyltransferase [Rubripirellula lacrimiformis]